MEKKNQATPVLVLNGPNLNLLGVRKQEIYGSTTLPEIIADLERLGATLGLQVASEQHNGEGELITAIQQARTTMKGLLINAGGYSHTSVAIRDALECFPGPIIEVHLSNIARRESFRHQTYISQVATGVIFGLGPVGYRMGLRALAELLEKQNG